MIQCLGIVEPPFHRLFPKRLDRRETALVGLDRVALGNNFTQYPHDGGCERDIHRENHLLHRVPAHKRNQKNGNRENAQDCSESTAHAVALAQVARHLIDEVYALPGQPLLRVALHYGAVQTRQRDTDLEHVIVGGDAVLAASRIEPHVEGGQIWATEEFRQQLLQRPSLWRTVPLAPPHGGADDRHNVKKPGSAEGDLWVRLYRLEV